MSSEPKNSRLSHVPAILAGSTALAAAISTLYVNLRDKPAPAAATQSIAAPPTAVTAAAPPLVPASPNPPTPRILAVRLDRVQVDDDGSVGSTDWTFQVDADGKPLFAVPMPGLNDKPGANLARPADRDAASAEVELPRGRNLELSVRGWKQGWVSGKKADVSGRAWMATGVNGTVVRLVGDTPDGPGFVLYFTVADAESGAR